MDVEELPQQEDPEVLAAKEKEKQAKIMLANQDARNKTMWRHMAWLVILFAFSLFGGVIFSAIEGLLPFEFRMKQLFCFLDLRNFHSIEFPYLTSGSYSLQVAMKRHSSSKSLNMRKMCTRDERSIKSNYFKGLCTLSD